MTQPFSPGLREEIKRHILAKYHQDSERWQELFGQPEPMRAFLRRVVEAYPQEQEALVKLLLPKIDRSNETYREQLKAEQMRRDGIVFYTDLPVDLPETCGSFETFKARSNGTVEAAIKAVRQWVSGVGSPMLTLIGPPGTGKTHLSTAAGRFLEEHGESVLFRREGDMMAEFRSAVPLGQVEEILGTMSSVPWLIVDDLGTANVGQSGMLWELRDRLFDARWQGAGAWKGALRTLVTTNLRSKELPPRVSSRLRDTKWGNPIVGIDAPDYRVNGGRA
ncbi:MAG: ATP-binding protein [Chloroflexota bacterium]